MNRQRPSHTLQPIALIHEAFVQDKLIALEDVFVISERMPEVIALDDALTALSKLQSRQSQVVELRFFRGCSVEVAAETLKVSPETVMRDWRAAKAWLYRELERTGADQRRHDA